MDARRVEVVRSLFDARIARYESNMNKCLERAAECVNDAARAEDCMSWLKDAIMWRERLNVLREDKEAVEAMLGKEVA